VSADQATEIKELLKTVSLNMAACYLKTGKPQRAIEECNQVLSTDKENAKALFRRGQAYLQVDDFYKAKPDLEKANTLMPKTKLILDGLRKIGQWEKQQDKKSAKIYKGMFDKLAEEGMDEKGAEESQKEKPNEELPQEDKPHEDKPKE